MTREQYKRWREYHESAVPIGHGNPRAGTEWLKLYKSIYPHESAPYPMSPYPNRAFASVCRGIFGSTFDRPRTLPLNRQRGTTAVKSKDLEGARPDSDLGPHEHKPKNSSRWMVHAASQPENLKLQHLLIKMLDPEWGTDQFIKECALMIVRCMGEPPCLAPRRPPPEENLLVSHLEEKLRLFHTEVSGALQSNINGLTADRYIKMARECYEILMRRASQEILPPKTTLDMGSGLDLDGGLATAGEEGVSRDELREDYTHRDRHVQPDLRIPREYRFSRDIIWKSFNTLIEDFRSLVERYCCDQMELISSRVSETLRAHAPAVTRPDFLSPAVFMHVDWDIRGFLGENYGPGRLRDLGTLLCFVGQLDSAHATTIADYMSRVWPSASTEAPLHLCIMKYLSLDHLAGKDGLSEMGESV